MSEIVGRAQEIRALEVLLSSSQAEFLALYGRRRVGKTYLIREFFNSKKAIFLNVTGIKKGTRKEQLSHFIRQVSQVFYGGLPISEPKQWDTALDILKTAIAQQPKQKKIILFLDELPWLATPKSRLLEMLEYYWNQHWSSDARVKLIICGSSASWIMQKIIHNKGGLYNRLTQKMRLEPFTLKETQLFLKKKKVALNRAQILMLYFVMGGIPYYLSHVTPGLSAAQLIEKLAFEKNGVLFDEFNLLFESLFDEAEKYIQIIRTVASHPYGFSQAALLEDLAHIEAAATLLKKINELAETGFITGFLPFQHQRQGIYYRVTDEYTLFYLRWIERMKKMGRTRLEKGGWQALHNTPDWHSWCGYAFEVTCLKHLPQIRDALHIPVDALVDSWRFSPKKNAESRGAQIDLLFDRRDNAITLCEIKYGQHPFVLTRDDVGNLQRKIQVFKEKTKTNKQLFLAMISAAGLKNNDYANDHIHGVATLEDLFK